MQDVAERKALAKAKSAATGKPVSPLPTRAPGGPSTPEITAPMPAGGLEAVKPGLGKGFVTAASRWLSSATPGLGAILQGMDIWSKARDLDEWGVIKTQLGTKVVDPDKYFSHFPDGWPVWSYEGDISRPPLYMGTVRGGGLYKEL